MVSVLDCTLRDGGRIIDCKFEDRYIKDMAYRLADAKIDIIEVGFLRDWRNIDYEGNSTFFTDVEQIVPFVNRESSASYVAFVDFGMFDFDSLKPYDGRSIDGIRVGFTKKDFENSRDEIERSMNIVKAQGYKLFIQGVNSLAYSDKEMLEVIELVNRIRPQSFGIVDTYGAMYADDLEKVFSLIHNNLIKGICVDFHSHNNYQLSFSLAQEVMKLAEGKRDVIIDATLNGMGKVAGNLNTELLVDFLVRKCDLNYEFNMICDLIDDYIYPYKEQHEWGYSIPALMAGIYQSHPNNVLYLTSKFRLQSRDIKNLIGMIDPQERQRYNYDNIEKLYLEYNATKIKDDAIVEDLRKEFTNKTVLVIAPGNSVNSYREKINEIAKQSDVISISVNFKEDTYDYAFFGNEKRFLRSKNESVTTKCIVSSNIQVEQNCLQVNYYDLINRKYTNFENSTMMLLYLLRRINVKNIFIAGFDGFDAVADNNYMDESFQNYRHISEFDNINREISEMLEDYLHSIRGNCKIKFVTPTIYQESVFKGLQ